MHDTKAAPAVELKMAMRKLWGSQITYTRNYIINALADLTDSMRSPPGCSEIKTIIGNAIKPYYGDDAGKKPHARAFSTNLAAGD
jgi:hypothetical protein